AALAAAQLAVLCIAAWFVGASAIFGDEPGGQRLALAGALLITPWGLFAFLAGFGPPDATGPSRTSCATPSCCSTRSPSPAASCCFARPCATRASVSTAQSASLPFSSPLRFTSCGRRSYSPIPAEA